MPTYEYECTSCGKNYEKSQSMRDEADTVCQFCGKRVRRIIHGGSGVIFKGSGFYVNDSRKSGSSGVSGESRKPVSSTETVKSDSSKTSPAAPDTAKASESSSSASKVPSSSKESS